MSRFLAQHLRQALALARPNPTGSAVGPKRATGTDLADIVTRAKSLSDSTSTDEVTVRSIHHLSCTGGTMITKCVASMANTLVLNEIDFRSAIPTHNGATRFAPTDVVSLLRQSDGEITPELIDRIFNDTIEILLNEERKRGRSLILRDHSHSHFLWGQTIRSGPTLRETLLERFGVKSVVTLRDPLDSYVSMAKQDWHTHFAPSNFDEYCRRYLVFLDRYEDVPKIKYEDFVTKPKRVMQQICKHLDLDYFSEFDRVFSTFQFSGDSGRSSGEISSRQRPPFSDAFKQEVKASTNYKRLIKQVHYPHFNVDPTTKS